MNNKQKNLTKEYLSIAIAIILSLFFAGSSYAQHDEAPLSLGIYPPVIRIHARPPSTITTPITIMNPSNNTVDLAIQLKVFRQAPSQDGTIVWTSPMTASSSAGLFRKTKILLGNHETTHLVLAPKQEQSVNLSITVPKDEKESEYYFSILFISKDSLSPERINHTAIAEGIVSNVLLSIRETKKDSGSIEEFTTSPIWEKGPVTFRLRVKNSGSHAVSPNGQILIKNIFGQVVGKIDISRSYVLAETTRYLLSDSSKQSEKTVDMTISSIGEKDKKPYAIWPEKFILGPYTATATVAFSDNGPLFTQTIYFIGFPLRYSIGILIAMLLVYMIIDKVKKQES